MREYPIVRRKKRTRQHILEDLSRNHIEHYAYRLGYSTERVEHDYGIDMMLFTYDENGQAENGYLAIQLKGTDSLATLQNGKIPVPLERAHLATWMAEPCPVILVFYHAPSDTAYWLYIQAYFAGLPNGSRPRGGKTVTVHIPQQNLVDEAAVRQFRQLKQAILRQVKGVIRHVQP